MPIAFRSIAAGALILATSAGEARAQTVVHNCKPVEVASMDNRIHIRCAVASGAIVYFALGTTRNANETAFALRALSLASTALVSGRNLAIRFDPNNTTGTAVGCLASDCRLIETIFLR